MFYRIHSFRYPLSRTLVLDAVPLRRLFVENSSRYRRVLGDSVIQYAIVLLSSNCLSNGFFWIRILSVLSLRRSVSFPQVWILHRRKRRNKFSASIHSRSNYSLTFLSLWKCAFWRFVFTVNGIRISSFRHELIYPLVHFFHFLYYFVLYEDRVRVLFFALRAS